MTSRKYNNHAGANDSLGHRRSPRRQRTSCDRSTASTTGSRSPSRPTWRWSPSRWSTTASALRQLRASAWRSASKPVRNDSAASPHDAPRRLLAGPDRAPPLGGACRPPRRVRHHDAERAHRPQPAHQARATRHIQARQEHVLRTERTGSFTGSRDAEADRRLRCAGSPNLGRHLDRRGLLGARNSAPAASFHSDEAALDGIRRTLRRPVVLSLDRTRCRRAHAVGSGRSLRQPSCERRSTAGAACTRCRVGTWGPCCRAIASSSECSPHARRRAAGEADRVTGAGRAHQGHGRLAKVPGHRARPAGATAPR